MLVAEVSNADKVLSSLELESLYISNEISSLFWFGMLIRMLYVTYCKWLAVFGAFSFVATDIDTALL